MRHCETSCGDCVCVYVSLLARLLAPASELARARLVCLFLGLGDCAALCASDPNWPPGTRRRLLRARRLATIGFVCAQLQQQPQ